jgi:hypothetical protein
VSRPRAPVRAAASSPARAEAGFLGPATPCVQGRDSVAGPRNDNAVVPAGAHPAIHPATGTHPYNEAIAGGSGVGRRRGRICKSCCRIMREAVGTRCRRQRIAGSGSSARGLGERGGEVRAPCTPAGPHRHARGARTLLTERVRQITIPIAQTIPFRVPAVSSALPGLIHRHIQADRTFARLSH